MQRNNWHTVGFWLAFTGLALWHLWGLFRYPSVSCDETFYLETAVQYLRSFGASTWPQQANSFFIPHGRLYWVALGLPALAFGPSLAIGRLVSWLSILLLVLGTRRLALLYSDHWLANWSAVCVGTSWAVLHAGHVGRPDIVGAAALVWVSAWLVQSARTLHPRYLFLTGIALILQLDIHLNSLHFVMPLLLLFWWEMPREHWRRASWLIGGAVVGGIALIGLHAPSLLAIGGTVLDSGAPEAATGNLLTIAITSIWRFWQLYYIWQLPYLSLVTASVLLMGIVGGWFTKLHYVYKLNMVSLVAFTTFGLINQDYQLLGYATLWLPLLMISGLATWRWLFAQLPFSSIPLQNGYVAMVVVVFFSVGSILAYRGQFGAHRAVAVAFAAAIPANATVVGAPYWEYLLPNTVTYIDEHNLHPFGLNKYWNGAPDTDAYLAAAERAAIPAPIVQLAPDYIIDDGVVGCLTTAEETSEEISDYVAAHCTLVSEAFIPSTDVSRTHSLYACSQ